MKNSVFILDDEQSICEVLSFALRSDYLVEYCTDPEQGLRQLRSKAYDLVLMDIRLGARNGLDILRSIQAVALDTQVIMMTAYGDEKTSVEAMKLGAFDYLLKPLNIDELKLVIEKALAYRSMNEEVKYLSAELQNRSAPYQMIGESKVMRHVFHLIDMFKDVDSSVLITGESGTGKELVARAIHNQGRRKNGRFVVVNCAAIPEGLLESEFFGHKRGAFTGAVSDAKGKLLLADKGTIFLDEIGDMPLSLQGKLLRALQEKVIVPVGDTKSQSVDVRVVAATNRNLQEMVANGTFREDLFYRLNVLNLHMPPLRERREDILPLCEHFIRHCNQEQKKNITGISESAKQKLTSYNYPGNVRQLANIIERAAILTVGNTIDDLALPDELYMPPVNENGETVADGAQIMRLLAGKTMKEIECLAIQAALQCCDNKKADAAHMLGISERSLWYKLKEYEIK